MENEHKEELLQIQLSISNWVSEVKVKDRLEIGLSIIEATLSTRILTKPPGHIVIYQGILCTIWNLQY